MGEEEEAIAGSIFRDVRRYYCQFCGICRSKKSLINSHLLEHHHEDMVEVGGGGDAPNSNTCEACGATFKKLAHLKQHMQSHSLERSFRCTVEGCHSSYRRKDHLNRHLLQHQGKLFKCPVDNCSSTFAYQANMKRHVKEFHDNDSPPTDINKEKRHACLEPGCNKVFRYASKLRKHQDSHVKLDFVEAVCIECMSLFTNDECLKAHVYSCHRYRICEICGTKQLQKNFKRHLRTHEEKRVSEKFKCDFKGCLHTFSTKSNLLSHVKAVHLELRPFSCGFSGCNQRFAYKHVRDNHEKTGKHVYTIGDFEETDEQFRSRPRGGRKRQCPAIETLMRKRVSLPIDMDSMLNRA